MATEASSSQPQSNHASAANVNNDGEPNANTAAASSQQQQQQQQQQEPQSITSATAEPSASNDTSSPQDPPASSPLPARHIAITPGARAQRLLKLFDSALTHTLSKISLDNFAACYPTIAAQAPHVLQSIQRGLIDRMGQLCQDEFGRTLDRYEVIAKLNELESLVGDAAQRRKTATAKSNGGSSAAASRKGKNREGDEDSNNNSSSSNNKDSNNPTPPHMLPAEAVLAAHLAPHLASQQSQLNARLQNTQAANVGLWEEIAAQRAEIEGLLGALEAALKDVDGAADLMDAVPAEDLAKESRQVEAQIMKA